MAYCNRKTGTTFEQQLCKALSLWGFWAHNLAQNRQGQPFDVITARNGKTYVIDCKVCEHNRFPLSRVEENQRSAMELWQRTGNGEGWFALQLSDGMVFMIPFRRVEANFGVMNFFTRTHIEALGVPISEWVKSCE